MLLFLDLETTGVEHTDKICSVGLVAKENEQVVVLSDIVNEGKKIASQSSAIHHITNEMVVGKPSFCESQTYNFLQKHNKEENFLVVHNAKFIVEKLASSGFLFKGEIIDTQRVTKHLIEECELFSLQYLRYELQLYKSERSGIIAHDALSDAYVIMQLFEYLLELTGMEQMQKLSFESVFLQKIDFGKYKGEYIEEIMMKDRGYLEWLLRKADDLDEDMRYSIERYLRGAL